MNLENVGTCVRTGRDRVSQMQSNFGRQKVDKLVLKQRLPMGYVDSIHREVPKRVEK